MDATIDIDSLEVATDVVKFLGRELTAARSRIRELEEELATQVSHNTSESRPIKIYLNS